MTTPERTPENITALFEPLPELDGESFTRSVMVRTKRIQSRRKIIHILTYLCVAAVCVAALPWPSLMADLNSLSDAITLFAEPVLQINILTEWLQSMMNVQDIQTQQIVMIAVLASLLGGVISFVMTEA